MFFDKPAIAAMEKRERAAFVNSLSGFKSANLVGTTDGEGNTNLAIMSSTVHLGSDPPLLALVVRPGDEERHTLANLLASGFYTLNHVTADIVERAHQTAARYSQDVSEFDATGLTPQWLADFPAPFVAEAGIKLGMELRETHELAINKTHLVIGEAVQIMLPEGCRLPDGALDLTRAGSVALAGLDTYHATTPIKRMAYAKPDLPPRQIPVSDSKEEHHHD
jgi:flavin reductase (DIM6/NTAB) family NADH-FMN oxidoreductase RutF